MKSRLDEDREFFRSQQRLADAASHWSENGRDETLLLADGKPLAEAEALVAARGDELEPETLNYIETSASAVHRHREATLALATARRQLRLARLGIAAVGVLAVAATSAAYLAYVGQDVARQEAERAWTAESRLLAALSEEQTDTGASGVAYSSLLRRCQKT